MGTEFLLTFADIERAAALQDPQLGELLIRFMEQDDALAGQPEEHEAEPPPPSPDAWTLPRLRAALAPAKLAGKTATERKVARREAWEALLSSPHSPPRLKLGKLLTDLYLGGAEPARAALMRCFAEGRLAWGSWQAFKQIYKLCEDRCDAAMFGVLACRLDRMAHTDVVRDEIGAGTMIYLRRRAWRFLRLLGQAVPEAFPPLAAQVLRNYPSGTSFAGSWVANQIWAHKDLLGASSAYVQGPPKKLDRRAFDEAWKLSSAPLLRLLEDAANDKVCDFAIRALEQDFPDVLRHVAPAWLARLGGKPLASVHEFIVRLLKESPELHQSKLRGLGLHEMVLGLLRSESNAARGYAIEYARAHAPDLPVGDLLGLLSEDVEAAEVRTFAARRLEQKSAAELGLTVLMRMVGIAETQAWATAQMRQACKPADITADLFVMMMNGTTEQQSFVKSFYEANQARIPTSYLTRLLDSEGLDWMAGRFAREELGKRPGREIGVAWLQKALLDPQHYQFVDRWLRAGMLAGDDVDVEWVKGLSARPKFRDLAIAILGNPQLVSPSRIGLPWLLQMAAKTDPALHQFAERYLLEHFGPEELAGGQSAEAGIEKLWSLAAGADSPEPMRMFASLYLRCHHPELGPQQEESKALGLPPRLAHPAYSIDWGRRCLFDARADVRRLGVVVAREELLRWDDRRLLYAMADSHHREPRGLAAEMLLGIEAEPVGPVSAEPAAPPRDPRALPADWLLPALVFGLAESSQKATREVALTVIRRHYERLAAPSDQAGMPGVHRLAWLMESPDRDVQIQAVRLLWDRHRPRHLPEGFKPKKRSRDAVPLASTPFESTLALRHFLRTVLLGLPPGRMERREGGAADRPWPASVAKQRVVSAVCAMAIEDEAFAKVVLPVLEEMACSQALGEWQGCVAALATIRRAHPGLAVGLPAPLHPEGAKPKAAPLRSSKA